MNFGKVKCLYDVLILNYHIKWGRFGPSKLEQNFLVLVRPIIGSDLQFGVALISDFTVGLLMR